MRYAQHKNHNFALPSFPVSAFEHNDKHFCHVLVSANLTVILDIFIKLLHRCKAQGDDEQDTEILTLVYLFLEFWPLDIENCYCFHVYLS